MGALTLTLTQVVGALTLTQVVGALTLSLTLTQVVGAVTEFVNRKEELKRMEPAPGNVGVAPLGVAGSAAKVVDVVVGKTVGAAVGAAKKKVTPTLNPSWESVGAAL